MSDELYQETREDLSHEELREELEEFLTAIQDDLEAAGHTVVGSALQSPTELRIAFEVDSEAERDAVLRYVIRGFHDMMHSDADEDIEEITIELHPVGIDGAGALTIRREWLPADLDADGAWSNLVDRVNDTAEVLG